MRNAFLTRLGAFFIAALLAVCEPAMAAYPNTLPTLTDFTVTDTLTATCASSIPTACATHSLLGSVTSNTGTAVVTIGGTFTGATINAEGGDCRTAFVPLLLLPPGSSSAATSSVSTTGTWRVHVQGFKCFQLRVSALTTGSVVAQIHFSTAVASDPLDGNGNVKTAVQNTVTTQPNGGVDPVAGQGTAGTPAGGIITIQGTTGMTPVHQICDSGCASAQTWTYFLIPASSLCVSPSVCVIKGSAATLGGFINESTAAQPAGNCILYNNASAASGDVMFPETTIGQGQILTFPYPGIAVTLGLVAQCAVTPTGFGLMVLFR